MAGLGNTSLDNISQHSGEALRPYPQYNGGTADFGPRAVQLEARIYF
jgi:hypothetical protein